MVKYATAISLMLNASVLCTALAASIHLPQAHIRSTRLKRPQSSLGKGFNCSSEACNVAIKSGQACDSVNGSELVSQNGAWTFVCDTDFKAQDIYPFILAGSFENCLNYCQDYSWDHGDGTCAGFVWAPTRSRLNNDCYLKSSVNGVVHPATLHLLGAVLRKSTSTVITPIPSMPTSSGSIVTPPLISSFTTATPSTEQVSSDTGQRPAEIGVPTVVNSTYLGTSVNEAASQYVSHAPAKPMQIAGSLLEAGINIDLITKYPMAPDTGSWRSIDTTDFKLANMTVTPRLSRDGGRGGNVNGTNIFIFCDTSTYGETKDPIFGYLNGFVSSSVAVDERMDALQDQPLRLSNPLGQWQDDVGRMRGWIPMTTGEESFNVAISGQGYRYAVWPNSSPIPLNETHAIMYAPLVYVEVSMQDQASPQYTSLGNTLLLISVDPLYGPHAERLQSQFFRKGEVNWGSIGGIRGWSKSGQNSLKGNIYLFGQVEKGILLARVAATDFEDRTRYSYWNGEGWSQSMPPLEASSNAFMIEQPVMSMDLVYSPAHGTFIMIYLTPEADNTFYYRYLVGKDDTPLEVVPPYEIDGEEKYADALLNNSWSEPTVLFTVPEPARGYVYAGGIHAGYFGAGDITRGGTKILCTWTEHTAVDPDKPDSGYAHKSQVVELGWGNV